MKTTDLYLGVRLNTRWRKPWNKDCYVRVIQQDTPLKDGERRVALRLQLPDDFFQMHRLTVNIGRENSE